MHSDIAPSALVPHRRPAAGGELRLSDLRRVTERYLHQPTPAASRHEAGATDLGLGVFKFH